MDSNKEISSCRMLEAVEIMLFEVVAEHHQLIARAAKQRKTILSDEEEIDKTLTSLAEIGKSMEKIHELIYPQKLAMAKRTIMQQNSVGDFICNRIYQQFKTSFIGNPMGIIANGHRSYLTTKAILARLGNILSKKRRSGLFDSNSPLLQVLSNNDDLFFSLFPPIEAWQESIGYEKGLISKMCHDSWKMKTIEALIDDGSGKIPLKQKFNFHSMSVDENYFLH